ncbi:hypothetical protein [Halalkalicoccus jeotgali]|uniref:Uncharacterized protein n=1 Tax=Halalkalicoccus jeotgali (strain DSM 18796 / CECT 7217 / JCM 14584 / KCTC 4019 / B3) TaxID=795797 RepID=D8J5Q0_HALJB|nr:hypothetical protein [Halalkalicoccus jeotgali]ADJ13706.1 hypothetical protein HacjB3_01565 [Halalkalicoccus jeotgali B3]ELY34247.1 hypothetical protein C497_17757 [Halalkalicoccus jeotgali B3]
MSPKSLPDRVTESRRILEEAATTHDITTGQMVDLQESIEFLRRLETSFPGGRGDD